jgi:hypothetical protein
MAHLTEHRFVSFENSITDVNSAQMQPPLCCADAEFYEFETAARASTSPAPRHPETVVHEKAIRQRGRMAPFSQGAMLTTSLDPGR